MLQTARSPKRGFQTETRQINDMLPENANGRWHRKRIHVHFAVAWTKRLEK
jgi:ribosomal protein L13